MTAAVRYTDVHQVDLSVGTAEKVLLLEPVATMRGTSTLFPVMAGVSMVDQTLDFSVGCAFGSTTLNEEGSSTQFDVIAPSAQLDMYFYSRGGWRAGGGLGVRYSRTELEKSFSGDFDGTAGDERYETVSQWEGVGCMLNLNGKYLFNQNHNAIRFAAGYSVDNRRIRALSVNGQSSPVDRQGVANVLKTEGLDAEVALLVLF